MKGPYLLGVDIGSSLMKTALFNLDGEVKYSTSREYQILHPEPLAAEHDSSLWLRYFKETIAEVFKKTKIGNDEVISVGIDCLCPTLIPVEENGEALRNSIFFMDRRNVEQSKHIGELVGKEEIFELTGNRLAPSAFSAPIILWIKERAREIYRKTHKFLHANGYLAAYLTDIFTMDWTNASLTQLFDTKKTRDWSDELCERLDIPRGKLPDSIAPWEVVGEVSSKAAKETGLKRGTVVAGGGADTACAAGGVGAVNDGDAIDDSGTATKLAICVDKPNFIKESMNRCHVVPDRWLLVSPSTSTGASLRWFRDEFWIHDRKLIDGKEYQLMDDSAAKSGLGANGLILLPYLAPAGERSPIWNPYAKGVFFGVNLRHNKGDFVRAILEAAAYALHHNIEVAEKRGIEIKNVRASGGHANSSVWLQIKADVTGKMFYLTSLSGEVTVFGASLLAGVAAKQYSDPTSAAKKLIQLTRKIEPNHENHKKYRKYFELYKELYSNLKECFLDLNRIVNE
jgi:xylulokinase